MHFAVPSKSRAGKVETAKVLPRCVIYVPENEAAYYMRSNPRQKIVGVPVEIKGITKTRNWILDNCGERLVVFVDDDVKTQGWVKLLDEKSKHIKMSEAEWERVCNELFLICDSLQWKIFGVATQSATRSVYPYRPILTRSYVTASFMGLVNDGEYRFDEAFPVKEDYEIGLRHVRDKGGVLCARHVYWENSHWSDDGGCKDYRTGKMELDCIKKLIEKYPGQIRKIERGNSGYSIELEF